ncbi:hypothetical protein D3OALGA1CA_3716 [Olavius algarvensis associated proteobacterium Delta 3]|nr:hypothetical protein D3OALGA1CA_3716 [Olavius algarvensis associated proteobacterium Delta 3]CAB5148842.1 hypothetical protein D3OALGB2SA_4677 [Olavius algarvensis associated proteobacterium Delta 3]
MIAVFDVMVTIGSSMSWNAMRNADTGLSLKEVMNMPSWKCANCGYTFDKDAPPDTCPSCKEKCEFLDATCYTPDCTAEGMDSRIASKPKE